MNEEKVLATVGDKNITTTDLTLFLSTMEPQRKALYQSPEGHQQLLSEVIHQELMYLDAKDRELDLDSDFQTELERVKTSMLKQYAFSQLFGTITLDEKEVKEYYKEHKEQFVKPVSIKASHILLKEEDKATEAYEKITEGTSFEDAAKLFTTCEGVDLGFFARGQMVQAFEDVAFSLKINEVSQPVKTEFGYHIIKVYE